MTARPWKAGAILLASMTALAAFVGGQPARRAPRLVLVLAIDQMRFDYLTRFEPLFTGGLKTITERAAIFTNAKYRHSFNETGPGHSVIMSGRHPSHSGIVANDWYDAYLRQTVNVVDDPVQAPVGGRGRGASPANLQGFTVGDVLKRGEPRARVVGVSLKDRSAVLMAGRRGDAAYWYETDGGRFITSTYYMSEAPAWLTKWNARQLADGYAGQQWTRLLPDERVYDRYAGKDAIEGEWDREDIVFPHRIRGNPPERLYYDDLRRTPFADELTLSVALEAMTAHKIGEDEVTDVLALGFSGTDVVGHTYGPDSHEVMDQILRLDLVLKKLFDEVDARVGMANTLVVLTADHGTMPLVENLQAKGFDAKRVSPRVLEAAVAEAFAREYPGVAGLIAYFDGDFYLDVETIRRHRLDRRDVEETAIRALLATGVVEKVYTHRDLASDEPSSDPFLPLFRNGFFQPRSPHLTVLVKPYIYASSRVGGTGHGTAHEYDRHVPVVFMGEGIVAGWYPEPCGPEDIAPTLADYLGLEFPREPDARVLTEMLAPLVER